MRVRPSKRLIPMFAMAAILLNFDAAFACSTREMAYAAAMKSDLRDLIGAQEAFLAQHQRYARSLDELGYRKIGGVAITIEASTTKGFNATATHAATTARCRVYVGTRPSGFSDRQVERESRCEGGSGPTMVNEVISLPAWVLMLGLTLTSFFVLRRRGRARWPAYVLAVLTGLYGAVLVLNAACGLLPVQAVGFLVLLSLGFFTFALWRRVPAPPLP